MEFALVASLLFLLLFAIVGYGLAFYRSVTVADATRAAARVGVIGATPCQMYGYVLSLVDNTSLTVDFTFPGNVTCSITNGSDSCTSSTITGVYAEAGFLTVQVDDPVTSPVPLVGLGSSYTITQSTTMMMENSSNGPVPNVPEPSSWSSGIPSWCTP